MNSSAKRELQRIAQAILDDDDDNEKTTKIKKEYNPEVERTGDKIIVPEGADLEKVITALQRKNKAEQQVIEISAQIPVPPWDGAIALIRAIEEDVGVLVQETNFWTGAAQQIDIEIDLGKTMSIPWGEFLLPSMDDAHVYTGTGFENNRLVFNCTFRCKRRFDGRVRRLLDKVRLLATTQSLHKGKAFSIAFKDSRGREEPLPKPRFFAINSEVPIFNRDLELSIERNVFVPLQQTENLIKLKEPLKRGALFAGIYGTGKTMLAHYIASVAVKAGWTFIYVKDSAELPAALSYAEAYQPVVVFAEDIDRVAGAARTDDVNTLLNQLDGIDSKVAKIMTILTTNFPETVNEAMRRPGRVDTILEIKPPDEEAVGRMIRGFARELLDPATDVTAAAKILAGDIPARIRETVGRAKLESLRRTSDPEALINGEDLAFVAAEVKAEAEFFARKPDKGDGKDLFALANGFSAAATSITTSLNGGHVKPEEKVATARR